jgi:predicted nucleic acid-binding protein
VGVCDDGAGARGRVMRGLEGQAEALAGTFNAHEVANTLWAACVFCLVRASDTEIRWVNTVMQRLMSLDKSSKSVFLNSA